MDISANSNVKRYDIEATIIRADGTIEPLGVIASTAWNKLSFHPKSVAATLRIKKVNRKHNKRQRRAV